MIRLWQLLEKALDCDNAEKRGLSHMALINIQKRILMVCGKGYGIGVESKENEGTTVMVKLICSRR